MNWGIFIVIAYGILTLIGGVIGYLKARSQPSLISGLISSLLLFLAAFLESQGNQFGRLLANVVILALTIVFAFRFNKSRKFMPAGLMLVAGVFSLIVLLFG